MQVSKVNRQDAQSLKLQVVELYRKAWSPTEFAAEKEDLDSFGERFLRHCSNPDFVMAVGRTGGRTAGFAYGYTSVHGGWWRQAVSSSLPDAVARRWFDDCFEFAELAVDPAYQRRGLGGALHDELLHGLPHQTAMLSTQEANDRARRFYASRRWELVKERILFPNKHYPYVILGRELRGDRVRRARET